MIATAIQARAMYADERIGNIQRQQVENTAAITKILDMMQADRDRRLGRDRP